MKVTTAYPVYIDGDKVSNANFYMNVVGDVAKTVAGQMSASTPTLPTDAEIKDKATKGQIWDKFKGGWRQMTQDEQSTFNKLRSSGVFSALGQFLGLGQKTSNQPILMQTEDLTKKNEEGLGVVGWSLIAGGIILVGGLIYFATRSSGNK